MVNRDDSITTEDVPILVVDDDPDIRVLTAEFLSQSGFKVYTACDGGAALELLKAHPVEIIITDIIMPEMDGMELVGIVKQEYDSDAIVVTGYSSDYCYETVIEQGASDFIVKPIRLAELLLRVKRVLRERRLRQRLELLAITDGLTGLFNARHFADRLKSEMARSDRYRHPLSLVLLDIDDFKGYNDNHGHVEGDTFLKLLADLICSCLRSTDTGYRYGGEEFTIILPETNIDEAVAVGKRIMRGVDTQSEFAESGGREKTTISLGVTEYCRGEKANDFVRRADRAMYMSKKAGRHRITLLSSAM